MGDQGDSGGTRKRSKRPGTLAVSVAGEGAAWTALPVGVPAKLARQVAGALARSGLLPAPRTGAALLLTSDAAVRRLNKQWRGIDKPTNVLSFPSPARPAGIRSSSRLHLGDLVLAEETLMREAHDLGIDAADHYRHLVLHGLLHLLGYDHETDPQAETMEQLEVRLLATLGVADPYAGSVPVRARAVAARPRPPRAKRAR